MARMLTRIVLALATSSACAHALVHGNKAFLSAHMQPELVARTLVSVDDGWKRQVIVFAQCNSSTNQVASSVGCSDAPSSFAKSCSTVVGAVVQGSSGDAAVAKEYMSDVCSQAVIRGSHRLHCVRLSQTLSSTLTADAYENRVNFKVETVCTNLWNILLEEEQKHMIEATRESAREAAEKTMQAEQEVAKEKVHTAGNIAHEIANNATVEEATKERQHEDVAVLRDEDENAAKQNSQNEEKSASESKANATRAESSQDEKSDDLGTHKVENEKIEQTSRKNEAEAKAQEALDQSFEKESEAEKVAKAAEDKILEAEEFEHDHEEEMANLTGRLLNSTAVNKETVAMVRNVSSQKSSLIAPAAEKQNGTSPQNTSF